MDVRKLLKVTCPLATTHRLARSLLQSFTLIQPYATIQGCRSGSRRAIKGAPFHTSQLYSRGDPSNLCGNHSLFSTFSRQCQSQHFYTRHGSILQWPGCQARRHLLDRVHTSSFHTRTAPSNHHRTMKSSLMNWRRGTIGGKLYARRNSRTTFSPILSSIHQSISASASASAPALAPASASASASSPALLASGHSISARDSSASKSSKLSNIMVPTGRNSNLTVRVGQRRRRLAAMHRYRLRRQRTQTQQSTPRNPAQLIASEAGLVKTGATGLSRKESRRERHRNWLSSSSSTSFSRMGLERNRREDEVVAPYLHIHYYRMKKFRKRLRFIGFTHFLRHSKMKSWRGKRASLRARVARSRLLEMKVRNSRYSWRRGYVPQSIVRLADLNESLENGNAESAIKLAKMLMRARREGARLPDGSQLVRLTRMDQAHYAMEQKGVVQSFASSPPSSKRPFLQPPDLQRFATMDYNTMLLRCQDLEDWENGYKVSLILLKRYRSPAFSFSDMSAPNTATICLMSNHFLQNRASEKAKRLSDILRDRYSKAIPLDMYVHIMNRAAHLPGQLPFMEFVSSYLRDHGPTPTTTLYNTLLRAHGFASGVEGAEAYLQKMLSLGCSADQQSFQILIDVSLKNLDLARAHRWLAECERQGFHATPRMMEPFMKACTQEVICNSVVKHNVGSPQIERVNGYVQEWMYKSLQVLQFMSSQRIMPTATTFEMLIEALLSQRNYREARKLLNRMRGSPHMYTPASKTWILFFEYHLATNNYVSAFNILKEMNRVVQPWRSTYMVNESVVNNPKTHPALVASLTANSSVVPVRLYRQLFRHLLGHSKVSLAERTLYEMMIAKRRRRPKEKEVADLIWSLDRYPEAAERVYELLYSQTWDTPAQYDPVTMILVNRITEEGPIQLGNVGVMRAKANSDNVALRDEVWWRWKSMIQVISSREDAFQMQQLKEGVSTPSHEVLTKKEKTVLAAAFEQVARASRQETAVIMEPELSAEAKALQTQGTDVASWSSSTSVTNESHSRKWAFGDIRRSLALGIGKYSAADGSKTTPQTSTKRIGVSRANWMLIQQLMQRQDFLKVVLDRSNNLPLAASTKPTTLTISSKAALSASASRLNNLKSSFDWVQAHGVPINIKGFNLYLEGLISHQDFVTVKTSVDHVILQSRHEEQELDTASRSVLSLKPDIQTLLLLNGNKGLLQGGQQFVEEVSSRGGPELVQQWSDFQRSSARKRRALVQASRSIGGSVPEQITFTKATK